ncbi:GNAT family N-acetyltransferase [Paenibacillus alkaliterrae]|uniref:GNAT family N-acetyltransferase n=1 Tax=Paenibacillus alkaliterrae TaxID=320909 RepID=UPI001F33D2C7|nr:GNAT family N-acetyltransferase [Paenibacillus alkaliterrae]MCF2938080.1 GNAT family N-acetyltransferase [Paenibacillus alkaliterrae]
MINVRQYSTVDHDHVWRVHLLVISEAGVEPTHQHYHDIFHIEEQYLQNGGEFLVVTEKQDNVIAMGGLKRLDEHKAEIKRLRVHPSYQKNGYGQLMLTKLEQRAVELGFKHIYLDALASQHGARKMFIKNGYAEKGPTVVDGFDVIVFEKMLA